MNKKFVFLVFMFFLLDRILKEVVFYYKEKFLDFKLFSVNFLTNTGTFWGFFKDANYFFVGLTIVALFFIYYYRVDFFKNEYCSFFSGLIVAGALGNLYDRLVYGFVIDFIDFHFWPVFNFADACISVGIVGLLFLFLFKKDVYSSFRS